MFYNNNFLDRNLIFGNIKGTYIVRTLNTVLTLPHARSDDRSPIIRTSSS